MAKTIDLGEKMPDPGEMPGQPDDDETHYPSIYLSGLKTDPGLTGEGTAMIKYRVRSSSSSENQDGEKTYSCDLEVMSITPGDSEEDDEPESDDDAIESGLQDAEAGE